MFVCSLLQLYILIVIVNSIPIDNEVEGDPELECQRESIRITFITRNNFRGQLYVKGLYDEPGLGCKEKGFDEKYISIKLPFGVCRMEKTRSLNPRGVFLRTNVVIKFHPFFITKVDRAYRVQCFYMETEKTVANLLEVSMFTMSLLSVNIQMPVCKYEIVKLINGIEQPVIYALVADKVYHKWTCTSLSIDTFCMRVHSCFVDDGNDNKFEILDNQGCSIDIYILNNLKYISDLEAVVESHVFKYADRIKLYFQCQITIDTKGPHQPCPFRPKCPQPRPGASQLKLRSKRSFNILRTTAAVTDVRMSLKILDIDESVESLPQELNNIRYLNNNPNADNNCVSIAHVSMFVSLTVLVTTLVVSTGTCMMVRRYRIDQYK